MAKKKIVTEVEQPTMESGIEQDLPAQVNETPATDAPASKPRKAKKPKADITLEDLCARYIQHL